MAKNEIDHFDEHILDNTQRLSKYALIFGSVGLGLAIIMGIIMIILLPFKDVRVFTVLVDKTTGTAEKIVEVQPTGIDDYDAVRQSLLRQYVIDRESYGQAGMRQTLEQVRKDSIDQARSSFDALWTRGNENYPPERYEAGDIITVKVKAVNPISEDAGQVRFVKQLNRRGQVVQEQPFVANIQYQFNPKSERTLESVWENPLGFEVAKYTVDAENLE